MIGDPISQFTATPTPRRWRKGCLPKNIDIKQIDCLLDIIEELNGQSGQYVSSEDFVAACARCHCEQACGQCRIPTDWAFERLENYVSLGLVAFAGNVVPSMGLVHCKAFRLVAFHVRDCSGNLYLRTTDAEADFQTNLQVLRDIEEVKTQSDDPVHPLEVDSSRATFQVEDYQDVIVLSDEEPVRPSKKKSKQSRVDKDAAFAAKLAAKEAKDVAKQALRATQRANRTIRQFNRQAARKRTAAANKFARQVMAKRQRHTISLTRACPLGYCRKCYAKLTPAFLKYSAASPGNYDLFLGFYRPFMSQCVVACSITASASSSDALSPSKPKPSIFS
jgi:hypothetical protein